MHMLPLIMFENYRETGLGDLFPVITHTRGHYWPFIRKDSQLLKNVLHKAMSLYQIHSIYIYIYRQ